MDLTRFMYCGFAMLMVWSGGQSRMTGLVTGFFKKNEEEGNLHFMPFQSNSDGDLSWGRGALAA